MATMRDVSRDQWTGQGSIDQINAGSLQRIADATEAMAKNYVALQDERDRLKRWLADAEARERALCRRLSATRGVVTRMKRGRA